MVLERHARPARRSRSPLLALVAMVAALTAALGYQALEREYWSASATPAVVGPAASVAEAPEATAASSSEASSEVAGTTTAVSPPGRPGTTRGASDRSALGEPDAGSGVADPLDEDDPTVSNLDPDLLFALREAATDASAEGVRFVVNSGWRSAESQARLLEEAIEQYGSKDEAARWVATPETSLHVSGDAVDLGSAAASWLAHRGAAYGLCQVYANEPWHFELRPDAVASGCPAKHADPTQDPRLRS